MDAPPFAYSNLPIRPSGRVMSTLAKVSAGIRSVQDQVVPYAESWRLHNVEALQKTGPLWVVLGDSMAQSIGASAYDRGWAGQLSDALPDHRMVNLSVYGARVRDVLDHQLPVALDLGDLALVTVAIGANDVVWRAHRVGLVSAFTDLIAALPTGSVVANLPNPHKEAGVVDQLLRTNDRGLVLADMRRRRVSWKGKLAADHFHPNDLGYAHMAQVFEDTVNRLA